MDEIQTELDELLYYSAPKRQMLTTDSVHLRLKKLTKKVIKTLSLDDGFITASLHESSTQTKSCIPAKGKLPAIIMATFFDSFFML